MSHPCIVPNCGRMVADSSDVPCCPPHWMRVYWFTRQRWADRRTIAAHQELIPQIIREIQLDETIERHPAGSHL